MALPGVVGDRALTPPDPGETYQETQVLSRALWHVAAIRSVAAHYGAQGLSIAESVAYAVDHVIRPLGLDFAQYELLAACAPWVAVSYLNAAGHQTIELMDGSRLVSRSGQLVAVPPIAAQEEQSHGASGSGSESHTEPEPPDRAGDDHLPRPIRRSPGAAPTA